MPYIKLTGQAPHPFLKKIPHNIILNKYIKSPMPSPDGLVLGDLIFTQSSPTLTRTQAITSKKIRVINKSYPWYSNSKEVIIFY